MAPSESDATTEYLFGERLPPPACETNDLAIAAPQEVTSPAQPNQLIRFLPIIAAVATVGAMAAAYVARSAVARNPVFMIFPVMMLMSAIATVFSGADRRRGEINSQRAEYFGYLSQIRTTVLGRAAAQHYSIAWHHPDPDTVWTLVGGRRMWERVAADADFCEIRVGIGTTPLAARLVTSAMEPADRLDPVSTASLRRFLDTHSRLSNVPIAISLRDQSAVSIRGDATRVRALLRAMICQLAVMHSPAAVLIAAAVSDGNRRDWEWLKWLPHNRHPYAADDIGPARMVYASLTALRQALAGLLSDRPPSGTAAPHIVVVLDGVDLPKDIAVRGITLLATEIIDDASVAVRVAGEEVAAVPDQLSYVAALMCARRLAGYRVARVAAAANGTGWQDLVGIADVASYSPAAHRSARSHQEYLRVPVGTTATGTPVELDIKESAANGMGPHGLCVGATGSGKSEFLRTVALGMIVGHSPEELNLVLVDFKGGATFSGLEAARHVAAVITNLSDKAALVARMRDALMGEMNRRQEVLRAAGNLDGIAAYQRKRRLDAQLSPLPALFIIVDEFSELLSQHPDFADVFVAIGRLGRSLGVHLLLASQRLDEGRLRGLESHLSYRVCLKTLSVNESRIALGTSEAYELPSAPGAAYLRVGRDAPVRFQTAFVSGRSVVPSATDQAVAPRVGARSMPVRLFTTEAAGTVTFDRTAEAEAGECPTVLQAIVERLSGDGPRAHDVWLPPLGTPPDLDTILPDAEPIRPCTVPIGIVDRPYEQRRTPLTIDLSGAAGNVAVVGAPQSGKSTALRTLVTALAVTHDPRMVQFYCLDFGGGAFASLRDWPHVGSVAGRADPERVRRTITRLHAVIRSREVLFRQHGVESMAAYRQLKATRDPICDQFGDIFLIVDGWLGLQREFEMVETSVTALAAEGLSYGVHVVISASRWAEIRPALRDQIGTRIELRLGDPADSELDRRRARQVPEGSPGRGLTHEGLQMVVASPSLGSCGAGEVVRRCRDGWAAPAIPVLPAQIDLETMVARSQTPDSGVILGVEEDELQPVTIDFMCQPHLLIIGDGECGKTATLRTVCRELLRTTTAAQSQLFIVDPRRSLLGLVETESGQLGGYLASTDAIAEAMPRLTALLRHRMPPLNATPSQLRNRSWWSGPEIYVVIDDYDLVGGVGASSLTPLLELLPHSRDVGLHLVLARRTSGAARAMFEPLLIGLRDAGCITVLMSGSADEGLAIGSVRPSPLPPGRGALITRRGNAQLVQVGWTPAP